MSGFIGNFKVALHTEKPVAGEAPEIEFTAGAILIATGFRPYVPRTGEHLYGSDPFVLTLPEFNRCMQAISPVEKHLKYQGRTIRRVAFLHCVGSRQIEGVHEPAESGCLNTYCSRTCCTAILQQALAVRCRFPDTDVFDLYQDIRTYGRGEEEYYSKASKNGVLFFRFNGEEPPRVERTHSDRIKDGALTVTIKDALTWGEELELAVDMVVLGTGMIPGEIGSLVESMKLAVGEDGFLQEVHPKLRPVEVSANGVLLAGTAQGPMNIQETLNAAGAAAAKAAAMFSQDNVELNPYVAIVDQEKCCGEAYCVTQCDYEGALRMVEAERDGKTVRRVQVNAGLCVGCGACVPVCPHRALDLDGWRLSQFEAMVAGLAADIPRCDCSSELVEIH